MIFVGLNRRGVQFGFAIGEITFELLFGLSDVSLVFHEGRQSLLHKLIVQSFHIEQGARLATPERTSFETIDLESTQDPHADTPHHTMISRRRVGAWRGSR